MTKSFLITGAAGFIGSALVKKLIANGEKVIGIDNLNNYYDRKLKEARLAQINCNSTPENWNFHQLSIEDGESLFNLFEQEKPKVVVNLAAQAGVRYSIENPSAYIQANLVGFGNILESCQQYQIENLIYASSSSVYGGNRYLPFKEEQAVNHPVSMYAATKRANELMAHTYSHLYNLPATGLRLFTVYGPWGRPDMAPMLFAKAIIAGEPIKVFNHGEMQRDFTYIDDIVEGIFRCCYKPATKDLGFDSLNPNPSTANAPHRLFNIGNSKPVNLMRFIALLEQAFGKTAIKDFQPIQAGDVIATEADTSSLYNWINFRPSTSLEVGVGEFARWYKDFFNT